MTDVKQKFLNDMQALAESRAKCERLQATIERWREEFDAIGQAAPDLVDALNDRIEQLEARDLEVWEVRWRAENAKCKRQAARIEQLEGALRDERTSHVARNGVWCVRPAGDHHPGSRDDCRDCTRVREIDAALGPIAQDTVPASAHPAAPRPYTIIIEQLKGAIAKAVEEVCSLSQHARSRRDAEASKRLTALSLNLDEARRGADDTYPSESEPRPYVVTEGVSYTATQDSPESDTYPCGHTRWTLAKECPTCSVKRQAARIEQLEGALDDLRRRAPGAAYVAVRNAIDAALAPAAPTPEQKVVIDYGPQSEPPCPETAAHGVHACTLPAGHAGDHRWDFEDEPTNPVRIDDTWHTNWNGRDDEARSLPLLPPFDEAAAPLRQALATARAERDHFRKAFELAGVFEPTSATDAAHIEGLRATCTALRDKLAAAERELDELKTRLTMTELSVVEKAKEYAEGFVYDRFAERLSTAERRADQTEISTRTQTLADVLKEAKQRQVDISFIEWLERVHTNSKEIK